MLFMQQFLFLFLSIISKQFLTFVLFTLSNLHTFNYFALFSNFVHFSCIHYYRPVDDQEDVMNKIELVDGEQVAELEESDSDSDN